MSTSQSAYRIALVQTSATPDLAKNLENAAERVREAASHEARIICLPELYRSPYFCQREDASFFDLAEPIPGPSTETFRDLARKYSVSIIVPIFERRAPGLYHNTAVVLDADGKTAGVYRKMHIPDDPCYYEKFYFTPGDLGFHAFDTEAGRIGVLICWDQWYPEAARITALNGAQVIFYPTAIGWLPGEREEGDGVAQRKAWRTIQCGHAVANGVYVAAVNRVGHESQEAGGGGIEFWGSSFLADPQGIVVAEAPETGDQILYGEIEPARIETVRRAWPFLRDRRVDAYDGILSRFIDEEAPR